MSRPPTPEPRSPRRATRLWRVVFVVYALLLTTATHWPRLELPPISPFGDKTVHFLAFALLTWLLWRSQWIRHRLALTVTALAWSALDEVAQAIPGVNRFVTAPDLVANGLGVVSVGLWLWALEPPRDGRRRWGRAIATTAAVAVGGAVVIVVGAYVHAMAIGAELPPGPGPRLQSLTAFVNPGLFTTLGLTAASLLGAVFARTLRARPSDEP
ncbi:MAG: hypothetical protein GY715_19175 [Planctomycetes bacterium]|nr:hypothetical protein [Planctomycetota bacterium]